MSRPKSSLKVNSLIIKTISFKAFARSFVLEPRRVSPRLTSENTFAKSASATALRLAFVLNESNMSWKSLALIL
ncbi:hypothetical protein D3C73_1409040 [compost metagenome]